MHFIPLEVFVRGHYLAVKDKEQMSGLSYFPLDFWHVQGQLPSAPFVLSLFEQM